MTFVLNPFAAGLPAPPAEPPTVWTLLAWVRRELFNGSPRISPVVNQQANGLITGNIGATDPDGDQLTYTVVGRPHNGGTLEIDGAGNFTYRPMNAMAAVGGPTRSRWLSATRPPAYMCTGRWGCSSSCRFWVTSSTPAVVTRWRKRSPSTSTPLRA